MELDLALAASQGGGVNVKENGVANFENCNIHDNNADSVCLHLELSLNFHPAPHWYAHCWCCVVAELREFCAESNPCVTFLELSSIAPLAAHCLRCVVAGRSEFSRQIEPMHVTFHRPNGA